MKIGGEKVRNWIRWVIIRTQSKPVLKYLFRWGCQIGVRRITSLLLKLSDVEAIYSRHTQPDYPSFVPGHSDLDVTIILSEEAASNPNRIEILTKEVEARSRLHFYLNPQDVRFTSRKELGRFIRNFPSHYELLYRPDDWVLLGGEEARSEKALEFSPDKIPWHPEFNKWWQHILQEYLMTGKPGLEDHYLRVFYRSALRQQLQFLAALGKEVAKPFGHVTDDLIETAFHEDPEMLGLLSDLKKKAFWIKDAQDIKERIFLGVLKSTTEFFKTYPYRPKLSPEASHLQEDWKCHGHAYEALETWLGQHVRLTAFLRGVLVYPAPHHHPYFYHVDLVIPKRLPIDKFSEMIRTVKQANRGREFHRDGHGYSITFVPESLLNWPLFFLGSPFPFLKEHIRRYGRCLLNLEVPALKQAWSRERLVSWCRIFLPYYIFNIARRVDHSSRSINFCQLASVRLFLETGEIETDPLDIKNCYSEVFKGECPEDTLWDYMMQDKPGRKDQKNYHAATIYLLKECERVERLLEDLNTAHV